MALKSAEESRSLAMARPTGRAKAAVPYCWLSPNAMVWQEKKRDGELGEKVVAKADTQGSEAEKQLCSRGPSLETPF